MSRGRPSSPARAALPGSRASRSTIWPARSPARFRAAPRRTASSIPTTGWSRRKAQGRSVHRLCDGGRRPGARRCRLASGEPMTTRSRTGVLIGSGIGGLQGIEEAAHHAARPRPAPHQPVLHPRPPDQPRLRPGLDPPRPQGPEPCGGHRLLDRRARHRRRRPADRARRCRRDGRRRRRIAGLPHRHGRLRRRQGAVDPFQRPADSGLAAL